MKMVKIRLSGALSKKLLFALAVGAGLVPAAHAANLFNDTHTNPTTAYTAAQLTNLTTGGTEILCSTTSATSKCPFDHDIGAAHTNRWLSSGKSGWVVYDYGLGQGRVIDSYALYPVVAGYYSAKRNPKNFAFYGTADDPSSAEANWVLLDTETSQQMASTLAEGASGAEGTTAWSRYVYGFANTTPYRAYKLDVTANWDATDNYVALQEVEFYRLNEPVPEGEVAFGEVTTGGTPAAGGIWASVTVLQTGKAATTVTCSSGETEDAMSVIGTWENVAADAVLTATNAAAVWGRTYLFKFESYFVFEEETHTSKTPVVSAAATALNFLNATASGSWLDGANWSLETPPNDQISACISNITTMAPLYLENQNGVVKALTVKDGKAAVDLRGTSTLTIGGISYGDAAVNNVNNGFLSLTGGVVVVNGSVSLPVSGARSTGNRLDLNGTKMTVNGALTTAANNDSGGTSTVNVNPGSVLTITNGLTVSYSGTFTVDAAVVTNQKNLVVANNAKPGTLILKNAAYFRQNWASVCGVGGKGAGVLRVLDGSTFDASGAAFYLGSEGDSYPSDGSVMLSNATFKASSFTSPRHTGFGGRTFTIDVCGSDSLFRTTGDATLGTTAMQGGQYRTSGATRMNVKGGSVSVGGTLYVGGGDSDRAMNYLTISEESAALDVGTFTCRTNATVKFIFPERGFASTVVIAATNKVNLTETMPPIQIDATACKSCAWTSLLKAPKGISNLTDDNLSSWVTLIETDGHKTPGDRSFALRLVTETFGGTPVVTALQFRVGGGGLCLIVR
jgi:hypothetical protein